MVFSAFSSNWQPDPEFLAAPLHVAPRPRLRLDRFPAGIDHAHIDVALPAELHSAGAALVKTALREEVHRNFWRQPLKSEDREVEGVFASTYVEASRTAVRAARAEARPEKVQLFQVAVLRHLFDCIDREMLRLREELETAQQRYSAHQDSRYVELRDRLTVLVKSRNSIRYRTARRAMRVLARLERGPIRKLRKAILGRSWPVPPEMLLNPLLQFGGKAPTVDFVQVYSPLLRDHSHFVEINRVMLQVLAPWLPGAVQPGGLRPPGQAPPASDKGDSDDLALTRLAQLCLTAQEREQEAQCWLSVPRNMLLLLGGSESPWPSPGPWRHPKWAAFQRRLSVRLERALERRGLLRPVLVSMRFRDFFRGLGAGAHAEKIYSLTIAPPPRRELVQRLSALRGVRDAAAVARRIEAEARAVRRLSRAERGRLLAAFAQQFAMLRRDLKLALDMQAAMDRLNLIEAETDRELSRSNGLLQEFELYRPGGDLKTRPVVGHVVLKADVRGSTLITAGMRARNQNPAAYFSRNLFDPITAMLPEFGAEKVFVEGDAVILMVPERESRKGGEQAVTRACVMGMRILQEIEQRNAHSRSQGLPELELGLGIAYAHEPPTYLYDHGHKIMISPAINRADRLSSCNRRLRALSDGRGWRGRGVRVAARVGAEVPRTIDDDDLARCNVNGIELDEHAFRKLSAEVALKNLEAGKIDDAPGTRYHLGQCADQEGRFQQLVVREAIVPLWLGNQLVVREQVGCRYYELINDPAEMRQVLAALDERSNALKLRPRRQLP